MRKSLENFFGENEGVFSPFYLILCSRLLPFVAFRRGWGGGRGWMVPMREQPFSLPLFFLRGEGKKR